MSTLAALLVIIACHADDARCLDEPVAVISYESRISCQAQLQVEMDKAEQIAKVVYGDCIPVDPALLAGRAIRQSIDPRALASLDEPLASVSKFPPQAFQPDGLKN
eukprot:gene16242-21522_t